MITKIYSIYQGDTSPIWEAKIYIGDQEVDMSTDPNWACQLEVKDSLNMPSLISKTIPYDNTNNCFPCVLTPSETQSLDIGMYYLTIQVTNLNYNPPIRKEIHHYIRIYTQNIIP